MKRGRGHVESNLSWGSSASDCMGSAHDRMAVVLDAGWAIATASLPISGVRPGPPGRERPLA